MYLKHPLPCLHCQPHDYIRMVQHMIERCLLLQMSRDDCVKALAKYAKIEPIISLTVWKELLKENKAFFRDYFQIAQLKGGLNSEEESIKKDDPKPL
ncbi:hypothetical protein ERO13_A05G357700v2 [Gossypium hirsutum]|uniref:Uncharacterized protein n=6 Tax=Gossypium TaxID=3633 RepID=A0ABR0Q7Z8_GOSAR|nr:uncharacterized protein LOC107961468 isoform X1 [Gossypium hirsutum]XP_017614607.1 uncharacterized protein LOC108459717 isoform X1 [Gossypium arboreum]KAB2085092.1 hypothetical protein ES319_A05G377400v1 [Gossypium barbadense]TYH20057.1 hypothetical protein ES288_A05G400900v1 [Gossypium darwinii]TYI30662.1 hypothetical protein ES332_A05G403200v1 [Gossypium tomentosum]TYJ37630.1 hypothetical protein E1A91_A05G388400v1 [Gossypium mustelinum]KAG4202769.1 hypothetical protein ERO13_A05G357700v